MLTVWKTRSGLLPIIAVLGSRIVGMRQRPVPLSARALPIRGAWSGQGHLRGALDCDHAQSAALDRLERLTRGEESRPRGRKEAGKSARGTPKRCRYRRT